MFTWTDRYKLFGVYDNYNRIRVMLKESGGEKKEEMNSSFEITWQRAYFTKRLCQPLKCLTSVFGMGTGVTTSLSPPDLFSLPKLPEN